MMRIFSCARRKFCSATLWTMSIILASNLGVSDDVHPAVNTALVVRLVIGGGLISLWNALHIRLKAIPVRS
jgi:hypothetical protein